MSDPNETFPVCSVEDVADGQIGAGMLPNGERVAVYMVDGCPYATDDSCTHGASSLSDDGTLQGHIVECGMHLGTFDVRTGAAVGPPCTKPLKTYPVEIRDGEVVLSATALAGELGR